MHAHISTDTLTTIDQQVISISLKGHQSSPSIYLSIYLQGIGLILLICGNIKNLCFPTCSATLTSMGISHVSMLFLLFKNGDESHKKKIACFCHEFGQNDESHQGAHAWSSDMRWRFVLPVSIPHESVAILAVMPATKTAETQPPTHPTRAQM